MLHYAVSGILEDSEMHGVLSDLYSSKESLNENSG